MHCNDIHTGILPNLLFHHFIPLGNLYIELVLNYSLLRSLPSYSHAINNNYLSVPSPLGDLTLPSDSMLHLTKAFTAAIGPLKYEKTEKGLKLSSSYSRTRGSCHLWPMKPREQW